MKTLVIGCTGKVGRKVVEGLLSKGVSVRCMSHSADKVKNLSGELETFMADLNDPDSLAPAFEGVDNAFLVTPVSRNETSQGLNAVAAARAGTVKKIVYLSVYMPEGSLVIPQFSSKVPIENAIKESRVPYTILKPNHFFQNDLSVIGVITTYGIYPMPVGDIGLNRIDVRDIADGAVNALLQSGHEGRVYSLHGPDTLNGSDMAGIYGRYVGRDVRYAGDDLDVWEQHVKNIMPEWLYRDMRVMFKYFQDHGMLAPEADLEKQQLLIEHPPRSFEDFAKEIAEEWKHMLAHAA